MSDGTPVLARLAANLSSVEKWMAETTPPSVKNQKPPRVPTKQEMAAMREHYGFPSPVGPDSARRGFDLASPDAEPRNGKRKAGSDDVPTADEVEKALLAAMAVDAGGVDAETSTPSHLVRSHYKWTREDGWTDGAVPPAAAAKETAEAAVPPVEEKAPAAVDAAAAKALSPITGTEEKVDDGSYVEIVPAPAAAPAASAGAAGGKSAPIKGKLAYRIDAKDCFTSPIGTMDKVWLTWAEMKDEIVGKIDELGLSALVGEPYGDREGENFEKPDGCMDFIGIEMRAVITTPGDGLDRTEWMTLPVHNQATYYAALAMLEAWGIEAPSAVWITLKLLPQVWPSLPAVLPAN